MRKALAAMLLAIVLALVGCGAEDALTVCKLPSMQSRLQKSGITQTDTMLVYHKDGYVTKTVFTEEIILKDGGDIKELKAYEELLHISLTYEGLQTEGYTYSTKIEGKTLIYSTTYDYTKMNIQRELEDGKDLFHINNLVNQNNKIPYDKVIEALIQHGFVCKEQE